MSEIDKPLFIIADGAAFGAYISRVMAAAKQQCKVALYLPESFEWLILRSGVVDVEDIETILQAPENYIDSCEYLSWERFFTELLKSATEGNPIRQYSKEKLKPFYTEGKNKDRILALIPVLSV